MRTKDKLSIAAITAFFIAGFFMLRALPDAQCGFLHYEEVVHPDGTVEFCATNHAGFLDLERLKYPLQINLEASEAIEVGQSSTVILTLKTLGGTAIAPHELASTHTQQMHVMLIDPSMQDYHHVHPEAVDLNGRYRFDFTPNRAGSYRVFTEIVPLRTRRQMIATGSLAVGGQPKQSQFESTRLSVVDGIHFSLVGLPEQLTTGRDYQMNLSVRDQTGASIELQTIMGARGHMVAFDQAGRGFAHMHPIDRLAEAEPTSDSLGFLFNVPNPGWYRVFAQVKVNGREVFGRFDLWVE
jgi:hypothetical protein